MDPSLSASNGPAPADATSQSAAHAAFVELFAVGWRLPKPHAFLEHFGPHIHPDVVAQAPLMPATRGRAAFEDGFRRIFSLLPDLTATVVRWASRGELVCIESECRGTLAGRAIRFDVCDTFVLRGGMIVERRSYFDPSAIVRAILLRPWLWPRARRLAPRN